jgi:D-alanyl-D-alanine carboxypeptidase
MFELKICVPRLPNIRALAPLLVPLAASAIGVIAVVALLMPGGHGRTQRSAPALAATSAQARCARGSSPAGIGSGAPATPARPSALGSALDAALRAARLRLGAPAATAAVVVCGRVVWADATGVLDLHSKRPADNQSLFVLNSAAKTVVATMVMLEIQDGHLSLGTKLSQFYPWLPNARQISVRMLLDMSSGLPDYLYNPRIDWVIHHRPRHHWTVDQVLTGLGAGLGAPKFAPGRQFQYSDTNYIVLGGILEQITHSSIERDFQQLIAGPLGITSATFLPTPAAKAHVAHPYLRYRNGTLASQWIPGFGVSSAVWGPVFTDGGLASSSLDLAWFGNALLGGRLVKPAAVKQMTDVGPGDYGFGMRGRPFGGHEWLGHRGYFGGFEVEDWTDPSRQVTIAVSTNLEIIGSEPTSTRIWTALARTYDRQRP